MKKKIFISLGVIASIGLGYFIYKKIKDRNKEIIEDGGFTIKVSEDATTDNTNSTTNEYSNYTSNYTSEYYSSSNSSSEEPSWTSNSYSEY